MIGIVDLGLTVDWVEEKAFYRVEYFRLTPLGGHMLGSNDGYRYEKKLRSQPLWSNRTLDPHLRRVVSFI